MAVARLLGDRALVEDESSAHRIYNKGAYGTPVSGGGLELDPVEATYLAEVGRLTVEDRDATPLDPEEVFRRSAARDPGFTTRYAAYRDLRERGHILQPPHAPGESDPDEPVDLHLYPRGGFPGKTPSDRHVLVRGESETLHPTQILQAAERAANLEKRVLVAVVDGEGDLTYYHVTADDPQGEAPVSTEALPGRALLLHDRVYILDPSLAEPLHDEEFFGHPAGPGLQVSLPEAWWLHRERDLEITDPHGHPLRDPTISTLSHHEGAALEEDERRARVYRDLKHRHLLPKTGYKFGGHFRVYKSHPDEGHAPYLVHAVDPTEPIPWPQVSGRVRLAHSVRKTLLLALPQEDAVSYLRLKRTRP